MKFKLHRKFSQLDCIIFIKDYPFLQSINFTFCILFHSLQGMLISQVLHTSSITIFYMGWNIFRTQSDITVK